MSDIKDLQKRALEIQQKYAEFNKSKGQIDWGAKEYVMGLVGDIGDLMKLAMAKESLRGGENVDFKLAHELSDCLWSVLVLAHKYGIDIEKAFSKTMNELDARLDKDLP